MSGKRNVSVCRGHELANALYLKVIVRSHLSLQGQISRMKSGNKFHVTSRQKKQKNILQHLPYVMGQPARYAFYVAFCLTQIYFLAFNI